MNDILNVNNLSKSYKEYGSELKRIISWFGVPVRTKDKAILKDISFSVKSGKAVGIVGRNGAGKSTLLKLITGTLTPSSGYAQIRGKTSAILELGMGFNPELTGRENVFHSSGLMGRSHNEIDNKINSIKRFADIGAFFDQPIRTYSSGMQARLAFAVATAFRPDLLIVDEALSVGDASFQAKCFQHMLKMKEEGTAILLVSHDAQAIKNFCDEAILIHDGKVAKYGGTKEVLQLYEKLTHKYEHEGSLEDKVKTISKAKLLSYKIEDSMGVERNSVVSGERIRVSFVYQAFEDFENPHFGIRIADRFGISIFETNSYCMNESTSSISKMSNTEVSFTLDMNLSPGDYLIDVAMVNGGYNKRCFKESISMDHDIATITVYENDADIIFGGITNLKPTVSFDFGV
ncbi:TPA: ABC transporter ATP-binding protein [Vibrio cholerae]